MYIIYIYIYIYIKRIVRNSIGLLSSNKNLKEIEVESTFIFVLKTTYSFNFLNHCIMFLFTSVKLMNITPKSLIQDIVYDNSSAIVICLDVNKGQTIKLQLIFQY